MLVKTTLVKVLYLNARLTTACPQLWKATNAIGRRTFHDTSSEPPPRGPHVKIPAAAIMKSIWRMKDRHRTHLCFGDGEKHRCKRLNKNEPMQNARMEIPDFFQRLAPGVNACPRYTVLPGDPVSVRVSTCDAPLFAGWGCYPFALIRRRPK